MNPLISFHSSQMFFLVLVTGGTCPMKNCSFIILKSFVRLDAANAVGKGDIIVLNTFAMFSHGDPVSYD